jgi:hypothetical protein
VLQELRVKVQGTFIGRYFTAGGNRYCSLNEMRYSENSMEDTSQNVDTGTAV